MVRFGWLRENVPGASFMVEVKEGRIAGSQWTVRGGLYPVKVKANLLWWECTPADLKVCELKHM